MNIKTDTEALRRLEEVVEYICHLCMYWIEIECTAWIMKSLVQRVTAAKGLLQIVLAQFWEPPRSQVESTLLPNAAFRIMLRCDNWLRVK